MSSKMELLSEMREQAATIARQQAAGKIAPQMAHALRVGLYESIRDKNAKIRADEYAKIAKLRAHEQKKAMDAIQERQPKDTSGFQKAAYEAEREQRRLRLMQVDELEKEILKVQEHTEVYTLMPDYTEMALDEGLRRGTQTNAKGEKVDFMHMVRLTQHIMKTANFYEPWKNSDAWKKLDVEENYLQASGDPEEIFIRAEDGRFGGYVIKDEVFREIPDSELAGLTTRPFTTTDRNLGLRPKIDTTSKIVLGNSDAEVMENLDKLMKETGENA